jgi:hypothetical protein
VTPVAGGIFSAHIQLCIMNAFTFVCATAVSAATITWGIIPGIVNRLHADTAKQCITHAWPPEQHPQHIAFCHVNEHPTEPKQYITTNAIKAF